MTNRKDPKVKFFFDHAYGKRPKEELYDLSKDPHQMNNVSNKEEYEETRIKFRNQLTSLLEKTNDPRLIGDGAFFENPPMAGPLK